MQEPGVRTKKSGEKPRTDNQQPRTNGGLKAEISSLIAFSIGQ